MTAYDREILIDVLIYHYRVRSGGGCGCGWNEIGKSWPDHVATMYEGKQREAMLTAGEHDGLPDK